MTSGYHALGALSSGRVIAVRLRDPIGLAKSQSALASAVALVPGAGAEFIEGQTYETVAQKIGEALATQGAEADVRVLDAASVSATPRTLYLAPAKKAPAGPGSTAEESAAWKFAKTYKWGFVAGALAATAAGFAWRYLASQAEPA